MYHIRDTGSNTRGEHVELKHGQRREIEIGNREKKKKKKRREHVRGMRNIDRLGDIREPRGIEGEREEIARKRDVS